ncbi:DNA-directed RNA polymerase V subunit 1 [Datura stramonium]|uniref:DNA-directed RNA polymerase n=1 Tax=Datura stramonium TaxID=4076 RepID=A0ABS8S1D3_DATST|nr:DNA-directed RNA polymerase V subunit 1 [Datura stramonium]
MCGPLSADFDGDCIHLFYPQSLSAKAEVVELFSVGKQLLSSHTGSFNLQLATPLLMENLCTEGFSISLRDFYMSKAVEKYPGKNSVHVKLLHHLRLSYNESVEYELEHHLRNEKLPVIDFVLKSSGMGVLIDSKSESAFNKVVQQIGFLGLQISDRGKFYSKTLVNDMARLFQKKYPSVGTNPSEEFGLVRSCLFYGLDPYQEMIHSISSREVIVRSTRGLTEPGTLFKNLMAILRDVVICYDGTVRNVSSNSIIQFEYGLAVVKFTK